MKIIVSWYVLLNCLLTVEGRLNNCYMTLALIYSQNRWCLQQLTRPEILSQGTWTVQTSILVYWPQVQPCQALKLTFLPHMPARRFYLLGPMHFVANSKNHTHKLAFCFIFDAVPRFFLLNFFMHILKSGESRSFSRSVATIYSKIRIMFLSSFNSPPIYTKFRKSPSSECEY